MASQSIESRVLDYHPRVREMVAISPGFTQWRDTVPTVMIDGESLYLPEGDVPRDADQLIYQWARRHGMLSDAEISEALSN
jgi:hypothetical protein